MVGTAGVPVFPGVVRDAGFVRMGGQAGAQDANFLPLLTRAESSLELPLRDAVPHQVRNSVRYSSCGQKKLPKTLDKGCFVYYICTVIRSRQRIITLYQSNH